MYKTWLSRWIVWRQLKAHSNSNYSVMATGERSRLHAVAAAAAAAADAFGPLGPSDKDFFPAPSSLSLSLSLAVRVKLLTSSRQATMQRVSTAARELWRSCVTRWVLLSAWQRGACRQSLLSFQSFSFFLVKRQNSSYGLWIWLCFRVLWWARIGVKVRVRVRFGIIILAFD